MGEMTRVSNMMFIPLFILMDSSESIPCATVETLRESIKEMEVEVEKYVKERRIPVRFRLMKFNSGLL